MSNVSAKYHTPKNSKHCHCKRRKKKGLDPLRILVLDAALSLHTHFLIFQRILDYPTIHRCRIVNLFFLFYYGNYDCQFCKTGFNCGEAANFATPQWLKVAKEAAVRRAAMNYLPMLSHQQLLYLLTISFVSRLACIIILGMLLSVDFISLVSIACA